ncbi:4Fe-4S ferredoxin iron-sulfur binding domain-containing protein [Thermodesulfobium narugense DSM 14796]|uniref:4Fe-4S ferredoxin iron-sulfur binding domain-containing protein n=1 Tax=Thermodesulfobium narugense DSM 14796 TaxID=747365 RepID=M1E9C6_9BACT|nr:4Fe-4S binding protein [Thermodesulfobium narugense]AEE15069.1 4Fe-4S ferredoxin iron-sulfur binding domain-containing protein [Thermodesulfobium narugense DSM 14796]
MKGRRCGHGIGRHHRGKVGRFSRNNFNNLFGVGAVNSQIENIQTSTVESTNDKALKTPRKLKVARVDPILCKGCEVCLRFCKKGAISIVDGKARVDEPKCVGCGACVKGCKNGAISLVDRL